MGLMSMLKTTKEIQHCTMQFPTTLRQLVICYLTTTQVNQFSTKRITPVGKEFDHLNALMIYAQDK